MTIIDYYAKKLADEKQKVRIRRERIATAVLAGVSANAPLFKHMMMSPDVDNADIDHVSVRIAITRTDLLIELLDRKDGMVSS